MKKSRNLYRCNYQKGQRAKVASSPICFGSLQRFAASIRFVA
jgi:hypothetical protein